MSRASKAREVADGLAVELLGQPLSARSIVASLLLGTHPPRLPAGHLVRWCEAFGIADGTTRVALSRMVASGELRAVDGRYELTGRLRRRQPAQDWSLQPEPRPWRGTWRLGLVASGQRPATERLALRQAAGRARLAELREGVWGRPHNLPREATAPADAAVLDAQLRWWLGRPDRDAAERAVHAFELRTLAERGRALTDRLLDVTAAVEAGSLERLPEAFVVGAAALQHVRRDPLLPASLAGADWPGPALRRSYRAYQPVFAASMRTWLGA